MIKDSHIRYHERHRFKVRSQSNVRKEYLVDLSEDPPRCDCPDWIFRQQKKLGQCIHVKSVLSFLGKEVMKEWQKENKE